MQFAITHWNASAERIFGWPAAEVLGHSLRELLFANQLTRFDTVFALTMAQGEWQGEFRLPRPQRNDLMIESSWSLVTDSAGPGQVDSSASIPM
ncbi:MAG: PAS domain-containing protein [Chthoniobacter sp.]